MNTKIKIFDGEYEIIYSGVFNIYNNILKIEGIKDIDYSFEFVFKIDLENITSRSETSGDDVNKNVLITFYNFNNQLGVANSKIIPILTDDVRKKNTFFSIHVRSLGQDSSFLQVVVSFYMKNYE